jgi:hypothetical protein
LALLGCTQKVMPLATGGSRSDGVIELTYDIASLNTPEIDYSLADRQAAERCAAWGYISSERFGGEKRICTRSSRYGCSIEQATITYQCTGGKAVSQVE